VHQLRIEKREGGEGMWVWVDSLAGLLGLVEMDVVEVHPWAATVDDIEHPDVLVTAPDRYTTSSAPAKRNRRILYPICATAAARRRSAPFPHARRRDFRSPRR
jgi:DNA primase